MPIGVTLVDLPLQQAPKFAHWETEITSSHLGESGSGNCVSAGGGGGQGNPMCIQGILLGKPYFQLTIAAPWGWLVSFRLHW